VRLPLALLLLVSAPAVASADEPWDEQFTEEGITVWSRDIPDSPLVEFRGRGIIEADIKRLMTVVRDDERKTEWMKNCIDARSVALKSATHGIFYNRTKSPAFFIDDRDVVIEGLSKMYPKEQRFRIDFWAVTHPHAPEVPGVVRMPELRGYWDFVLVAPGKVEATYQVRADAGGMVPMWVVNWVNRKLPFHTINDLRAQVKKDGYDHLYGMVELIYDWDAWSQYTPTLAADSGPPLAAPAPVTAETATHGAVRE